MVTTLNKLVQSIFAHKPFCLAQPFREDESVFRQLVVSLLQGCRRTNRLLYILRVGSTLDQPSVRHARWLVGDSRFHVRRLKSTEPLP